MFKVHLTPDETGLVSWVTAYLVDVPDFETEDPDHPMKILTDLHPRDALHEAGKRLEENFNGPGFCWVEGPVDKVTKTILRVCVENGDYPSTMAQKGHDHLAQESLGAVRSLAYKLEELGIEVDHLPGLVLDRPTWSAT